MNKPDLGHYPGVFDFRDKQYPEAQNLWYGAMLFWDAFMVLMAFHDTDTLSPAAMLDL